MFLHLRSSEIYMKFAHKKYIPTLHSIVMIMLCALFLHIYKLDHSLDDDQKILPISNVMAGYLYNKYR